MVKELGKVFHINKIRDLADEEGNEINGKQIEIFTTYQKRYLTLSQ
jgi:hypothetical protein